MNKLTFHNPKTKQTQEVGENETVKLSVLRRLGWQQVGQDGEQQTNMGDLQTAPTMPADKSTMPGKLPPEGQVPAKNVTPTRPEAVSHPVFGETPKRKRSDKDE
jgi:hypothetical protein